MKNVYLFGLINLMLLILFSLQVEGVSKKLIQKDQERLPAAEIKK